MFNPDQDRDERGRFAGGGSSPVSEKDRPRNYGKNVPISAKAMRAYRLSDAKAKRLAVAKANRPQKIDRAKALFRAVHRARRLSQRPSNFTLPPTKRYEQ